MTRLIAALGCLLVPVIAAIAQPTSSIEKPDLRVGDRWAFRSIDLWKNEETQKVEYQITGVNADNVELSRTTVASKTDANVGRLSKRKADRSTWTFINPSMVDGKYVAFAFPLDVGKTWEYEFSFKARNGDSITQSTTAKAEAWEDVQVPSGKFKALKVVHSGHYTRSTPMGSYSGNVSEVFWYVPEVRWYVRREYRDTTSNGKTWDHIRDEITAYEVR